MSDEPQVVTVEMSVAEALLLREELTFWLDWQTKSDRRVTQSASLRGRLDEALERTAKGQD